MQDSIGKSSWVVWVPNLLSGLRAVLAIAFPLLSKEWHLVVILIAGATDFLDGFIARSFHAQSATGKWLDPLADKMLIVSVLTTLAVTNEIAWWQAGLVCVRDVVVIGLAAIIMLRHDAARFKNLPSAILGKITTALVFSWILTLLLGWNGAATYVFGMAATSSIITTVDYVIRYARTIHAA